MLRAALHDAKAHTRHSVVIEESSAVERRGRRTSYLIKRAQVAIGSIVSDAVREFGLTAAEYVVLSLLGGREGLSSADLARRMAVTPQALTALVAELEDQGLIRRRPSSENRRILQMQLTTKGRNRLERCERAVDRAESDFLAPLDGSQITQLRVILERLLHRDPR